MMHTHSGRLERWLGPDVVAGLSQSMRDWYGPPIPVQGVPGGILVHAGGDFTGVIHGGREACVQQRASEILQRERKRRIARASVINKQHGGFSSLSDLIAEASAGKQRDFFFQKVGVTGVAAATNTLWYAGNQPAAGAAAAAAPGGTAPDDSTTGAFPFTNPTGGDTQHIVSATVMSSQANGPQVLLYDRLFSVTKTMSSSGTESVTGVPTRYQSTTSTAADYAGGNFLMVECRTALSATAHNWTTCLYTDQDGNTGATLPSVTGNSSNIQYRLDQPTSTWFCPLASGDTGIKALTQMQCSSAALTGAIDFTIGHPIAWMPCPSANIAYLSDYINTTFNLARIFDDACLALLEALKPGTAATTYTGQFTTVAG